MEITLKPTAGKMAKQIYIHEVRRHIYLIQE